FTLSLNPGQTIAVLITPTSTTLQPSVTLKDPSNAVIGTAAAGGAGQSALLQTIATTTGGNYSIVVASAGSTVGNYTVAVTLNAALENEGNLSGSSNDTRATAQDLTSAFVSLQTSQATAQRTAVIGGNPLILVPGSTSDFESGEQGYTIN